MHPSERVSARKGSCMAYDARHGVVVLFGGFDSDQQRLFGETWEWDGKDWRLGLGPPKRRSCAMAYDAAHDEILMFGGTVADEDGGVRRTAGDTWTYQTVSQ
jgi:hypothetical protein